MSAYSKEKQSDITCYPNPLPLYESDLLKRKRNLWPQIGARKYAPFIKLYQKPKGNIKEKKKYKRVSEKRKPTIMMADMTTLLYEGNNIQSVLLETAAILRGVTNSKGVTIFMVDEPIDEIHQLTENYLDDERCISYKIKTGTNVASHVASTKEFVKIDDILEDIRFPDGLGNSDVTVKSVLGVPVMTPEDDCIAVFILHRDIEGNVYDDNLLRLVIVMSGWIGSTIYQNSQRLTFQKQQELNECLLNLTKYFFTDAVELDKLISEVVNFAKVALNAEHGAFYVVKPKPGEQDLYADCYEEGLDEDVDNLYKKNIEMKLNNDNDIVTQVIKNGTAINIRNAYTDDRIVQDKKKGYIIRSLLSIPIKGIDEILGVIQIMNKKKGSCFTKSDEILFHTFSVHCAFVLSYARLSQKKINTNMLNQVYEYMLSLHMPPCIHDYYFVYNHPEVPSLPHRFNQFDFYISDSFEHYMPQLVMYMFNETSKDIFENLSKMTSFVLTVQKSYHSRPYHNFYHAFNVMHSSFNMVKRNMDLFTLTEAKAIVFSAYCHDIDHYGVTNNFLEITNHFLSQLYEESVLEFHHYHISVFIIKFMKLFSYMSAQEYKHFILEIRHCILSTDLALYFKRRGKLFQICAENSFNPEDDLHRQLLKSIVMTMADLSGLCKPFHTARNLINYVYKEFYNEGDKEKKMGLCPLSIMDREKTNMIPADQVQFMTVVVLPCALLIAKLLPNCSVLYKEGLKLRDTWQEITDNYKQGQKVWNISDYITL